MRRIIALITVVLMLSLCAVGCSGREYSGGGGEGQPYDEKTATYSKLYIGNFDGGFGDEWLYEVIRQFKEKFKDYSFEDGKVGVDIEVDNVKGTITGSGLFSSMSSSRDSIFFTEDVNYYDGINLGAFADITPAVTANLSEFGDTGTVVDKLPLSLKEYYKNTDGKYYGLPFYDGFGGFYYDKDLFDEYLFYFKDGATADGYMVNGKLSATEMQINNLFIKDTSEKLSAGPDNVAGTYDDGLPATYADFYALMEYMAMYNVKPYTWTGQWRDYSNMVTASLWADYEGKENMELLYNMNGTANDLISVDNSGNITTLPAMTITQENAYNLHKQAGKYYALSFVNTIVSDERYYASGTFSSSTSNTGAQQNFVLGRFFDNKEDIGMIVEGSWWYSEAKSTINSLVAREGDSVSWDNRHIGFMPMPKATRDKVGEKGTIVSTKKSVCVVNNTLYQNMSQKKKDLVMKFLAFAHTNNSLYQFTKYTGATRPFEYNLGEKENELNFFAKSIYNIKKNYNVVYPYSKNSTVLNHPTFFKFETLSNNSLVDGVDYTHPAFSMQIKRTLTAKDYFDGMYNYYSRHWSDVY